MGCLLGLAAFLPRYPSLREILRALRGLGFKVSKNQDVGLGGVNQLGR
jgi:hypothetical protein